MTFTTIRTAFQYHTGSIQTLNIVKMINNYKSISIPHWFYSNTILQTLATLFFVSFQYHTGSIQTEAFVKKRSDELRFQYHTGSIQT